MKKKRREKKKKKSGFQYFLASEKLLAAQNQGLVNSHLTNNLQFLRKALKEDVTLLETLTRRFQLGVKWRKKYKIVQSS